MSITHYISMTYDTREPIAYLHAPFAGYAGRARIDHNLESSASTSHGTKIHHHRETAQVYNESILQAHSKLNKTIYLNPRGVAQIPWFPTGDSLAHKLPPVPTT